MKVSVVGQGYVGLPLAMAAVDAGHDVIAIDLDTEIVEDLTCGKSHIKDISSFQIQSAIETDRYKVSSDFNLIDESDVVVICVPTPLTTEYEPDYSYLESAVISVSQNLKVGALVIIESTVSPGITRGLVANLLNRCGKRYELAYSPERIDPGNTKWNVSNTPKLVSGITNLATQKSIDFYKSFIREVITAPSVEVIETAKLLENSFRLINISFINEIAEFCWKMKINVREVIDAAATKPYGFMPFYPSAGVGGHCIPVDPLYLSAKAKEVGANSRFIDLAHNLNHSLPQFFTGVATGILGSLTGKRILVVGIAYKPNVSDVRETPSLGLIQALRNAGSKVSWHDELVKDWMGEKSASLSSDYDLIVLVNPHTGTDLTKLGDVRVLDTRGGY